MMQCGGKGQMSDASEYTHYHLTQRNDAGTDELVARTMYPKGLDGFFNEMVFTVLFFGYKRGKRIVDITVILDKSIKNEFSGHTFNTEDKIIIIIKPAVYKNLRQSKFNNFVSNTTLAFFRVLYHELYHFKHNRGKMYLDDETEQNMVDYFLDWMYEKRQEMKQ